jgi:hypothetical protein
MSSSYTGYHIKDRKWKQDVKVKLILELESIYIHMHGTGVKEIISMLDRFQKFDFL